MAAIFLKFREMEMPWEINELTDVVGADPAVGESAGGFMGECHAIRFVP